ncbi:uncharacterized protein LOC103855362 isoform X1 [Brassica rapa]|uniref:uncharacterized protein LOC103855362 isoform X1 n=1 Tax=Brassica campestris TaxID=3711 RepID=UPI0004F15858|nr:uncharacterized protein LOC103855362 isoform X1 [Brassica rapa]XP_009130583.1 uncharacterized protein LOC103855362 isoform X1 [Brassica rapa]XP_009130585.1 uncharacterized protein LOC103855362 isoform X1 [Brassica rapa]XP_013702189.2 uncharacterized protein LOC106406132 isoform X1 [Brassica napus]XP_013702198.2 uncharacterized protein LOC106406132 isoform X1 [Brassica napus]XP_013702204.2 uncharacterized protein LOC106406132 isoform X1 [Brassica napus]
MKKTLLFITGIELLVVNEPTRLCISENRLTDEELKIAGVPQVTSIGVSSCRMRWCYVGYSRKAVQGLIMESSTVLLILKRSGKRIRLHLYPNKMLSVKDWLLMMIKTSQPFHSWEWSRDWNWDFIGQFSLSVHPLIIGVTGLLLLERYHQLPQMVITFLCGEVESGGCFMQLRAWLLVL